MARPEKELEYAGILLQKIQELFDEENESGLFIDKEELNEGNNATHFIHALANMMPTAFYNNLVGDDKNNLEFNHLANQLVFQYSKKED